MENIFCLLPVIVEQQNVINSKQFGKNTFGAQQTTVLAIDVYHGCHIDMIFHDGAIEWNHFPRYWPYVRGIHRSPVNSPHKDRWGRALIFSLVCAWLNGWVNNREAGLLRSHRAHYDVIVMLWLEDCTCTWHCSKTAEVFDNCRSFFKAGGVGK